jgi:hypothetical protein
VNVAPAGPPASGEPPEEPPVLPEEPPVALPEEPPLLPELPPLLLPDEPPRLPELPPLLLPDEPPLALPELPPLLPLEPPLALPELPPLLLLPLEPPLARAGLGSPASIGAGAQATTVMADPRKRAARVACPGEMILRISSVLLDERWAADPVNFRADGPPMARR